jgi:hypothetical protein
MARGLVLSQILDLVDQVLKTILPNGILLVSVTAQVFRSHRVLFTLIASTTLSSRGENMAATGSALKKKSNGSKQTLGAEFLPHFVKTGENPYTQVKWFKPNRWNQR